MVIIESSYLNNGLLLFSVFTFEYNPLIGLIHLKIGKILMHLEEFESALDELKAASKILKVSTY